MFFLAIPLISAVSSISTGTAIAAGAAIGAARYAIGSSCSSASEKRKRNPCGQICS